MIESKLVQKDRYIIISVDGDTVTSKWGKIGGKEQTTSHTYDFINKGKANELSPIDAALADFDRKVEKKMKEGYKEVLEIKEITEDEGDLDFDAPQTSFTLSKPITKIADKKLQELLNKNQAILQEKENGMCHWVVLDSKSNVSIYTRRMNDHTRKYPGIVEEFKKIFPPGEKSENSVFGVELIVDCEDHHRGFRLLQEISKSDTLKGELKESQERSYELQETNPVRACVFCCLYGNGAPVWRMDYEFNRELLNNMLPTKDQNTTLFRPVELNFTNVAEIKEYLRENEKRLEGIVCWDKKSGVEVSFDGKPKRRASYKIKVPKETDVVAWGWVEGTGDHQGKIGALRIGKYRDGALLDYGKVGSGLSDEICDPEGWDFPCVIEIEYEYHEPTGKFKFPRFSKIHEDKVPSECIAEEGEAPDAVNV